MKHATAFAVFLLVSVGCATFEPADTLRPRAAYDLNCPQNQLAMNELGGDCGTKLGNAYNCTIGVRGCNQQATYVHVPNGDWVMNNR